MTEAAAFPIVGIGASAGGVEALEGFFSGVPDSPGFAVVIVTHLNPARTSLLPEIVARYTTMPVRVAEDGLTVETGTVYVMPEAAFLTIAAGRLGLRPLDTERRGRKPIDTFFAALGHDQGGSSAGIILSGGDGDGTLGIRVIKERGGLTLAQVGDGDGHGPNHPSMPDSAIATGHIDFAVPAGQMGARLVEFARSLSTSIPNDPAPNDPAPNDPTSDGLAQADPASLPGPGGTDPLERERGQIYAILRSHVGHDFSGYKTRTFMRRVQRRMQVAQAGSVDAYIALLRHDPAEAQALFRDLLINVTSFFRDTEAFENLATLVIPKLFEGRSTLDTVRVWVPGCATGEEVYSIAILLREYMAGRSNLPRLQIFATDIDEHALGVARAARYPAALMDAVSPERRSRFFTADAGAFVLTRDVRDLCIFSPHNVVRDPPFSRMDLVSCRNLLIYFAAELQNQVLPTFHYALREGGFLFLGTSENVLQFRELFTPLEKQQRIFRRRGDVSSGVRLPLVLRDLRPSPGTRAGPSPQRALAPNQHLRQSVQAQVLDRFAPPHVLVNREGDVVYFSGRTGRYLEAAAGLPTRQLLTMARKGLRLDLRTLLRDAAETGRAASRGGISVEGEAGRVQVVTLTVEPLAEQDGDPLYLVLFTDDGPAVTREEAARSQRIRDGLSHQLEQELRETRERLQSLVDEYETALEDLKSSNEELQSVNEEFQSTNEELEASKEELQSVNEELHTVNSELTGKVDALDRANTDLQSLFDGTEIATVFVDSHLVIRSYTPAITRFYNILQSDRGRPLTDLTGRIRLPSLAGDVQAVIATGQLVERQVDQIGGEAHLLLRVTPYRDIRGVVDGAAVTFVDITSATRAEARLDTMVAERDQRTRSLLVLVQSIARQTIGRGGSLEAYWRRLSALGRAQDMIAQATGDTVDLGSLLRLELAAYGTTQDGQVTLAGPVVPLRLDIVQPLAVLIHELAANAAHHGALRSGASRLSVSWRQVQHGANGSSLVLDWQETGVAIALDAMPIGFGRQLLQPSLAPLPGMLALGAQTVLAFGPDGMTCRIELPDGRPDAPEFP